MRQRPCTDPFPHGHVETSEQSFHSVGRAVASVQPVGHRESSFSLRGIARGEIHRVADVAVEGSAFEKRGVGSGHAGFGNGRPRIAAGFRSGVAQMPIEKSRYLFVDIRAVSPESVGLIFESQVGRRHATLLQR